MLARLFFGAPSGRSEGGDGGQGGGLGEGSELGVGVAVVGSYPEPKLPCTMLYFSFPTYSLLI